MDDSKQPQEQPVRPASGNLRHRLRANRGITLILIAFLATAFAYSVINPLHEATDELRHYRFVRYIVQYRSLPVQGLEPCRSQSHHPPLIYLLGAAATAWIDTGRDLCATPEANPFWGYRYADVGVDNKNQYLHGPDEAFPWQGEALAVHILRALNILIGAGVVWLTWATGRAIWPAKPYLAVGGTAFVAFNPMFLYMSGAINNDIIAAFSGAAVLYGCVRLMQDPAGLRWRWGVILGGLYGLALMSKFNMAAVLVLIAFATTWVAWQQKQWRRWLLVNGLIVLTAALLAGWWFARNQLLYGEPTGFQILTDLWGMRDPAESFPVAVSEFPYLWTTLWGRFGFGQIPLPALIYDLLRWLVAVGLAGVLVPLVRRGQRDTHLIFILLLALNIAVSFAVVFNYMLVSPAGAMGRFFFPGLPALALLTFYGLYQWGWLATARRGQDRWPAYLAWTVNGGMLLLALIALFGYLAPAYAPPPSFTDADLPNAIDAQFDALVKLRGYSLSAEEIQPGGMLDVDLFWEVTERPPGNFLLFVHMTDEHGLLIAQRDTHPGLGNFPSSQWQPGDRFHDTVRLHIPETAYAPGTATIILGLYAPTYRLAISDGDGESLGDALTLGNVILAAGDGPFANAQQQSFNDEIEMVGYEYSSRELQPGDALDVTLFWRALQDEPPDYTIEVRLVEQSDHAREWVQADSRPQAGASPTDTWQAGETITDTHRLQLPPDLPEGAYHVEIALRDAVTGLRQNIVADDGHWIADYLLLAPIRVEPR